MTKRQIITILIRVFLAASILVVIGTSITFVNLQNANKQSLEVLSDSQNQSKNPPTADQLLKLTNQERSMAGLQPLQHDARLDASAQEISDKMLVNNYFDHVDPQSGVRNASLIFKHVNPHECQHVSENIAKMNEGYVTSDEVVKGWMNSKSHREAILDNRYNLVGFGVTENIVVQHFCQLN